MFIFDLNYQLDMALMYNWIRVTGYRLQRVVNLKFGFQFPIGCETNIQLDPSNRSHITDGSEFEVFISASD